ncbi:MAG: single-stranded DNA-binding protein [Patescibacteria group bacterium]|jgi:single-strand DNA-binding protein|nr:single-stranded DNA-binding protein [Patescibacteria group bacterium]
MNFNRVFILGNLTRDPELRTTPSGQSVATFGVATNRIWTDKNGQRQSEVEFHNIVVWGKLAETASRYLTKGKLVFIEGRLKTRNWTDQNGVRHSRTEIIAQNFQLGPRSTSSAANVPASEGVDIEPPANLDEVNIESDIPIVSEDEISADDLPF